jgi:hypothetical protein
VTGFASLVAEQAVTELAVVAVGVEQRVRQVRLLEVALCERGREPPVVRLSCELQDPARHRDGNPVGGELSHERVDHLPGRCACDR